MFLDRAKGCLGNGERAIVMGDVMDGMWAPPTAAEVGTTFSNTEEAIPRGAAEIGEGWRPNLRRRLVAGDMIAAAAIWSLGFRWGTGGPVWKVVIAAVAMSGAFVLIAKYERLYKSQVCALREVELARLASAVLGEGLFALAVAQGLRLHLMSRWVILAMILQYGLVSLYRISFAYWIRGHRMAGRLARHVVIIGDNDEAVALHELTLAHPETGYQVVGWVGDPDELESRGVTTGWRGRVEDLPFPLDDVAGVIVAASAVAPVDLNRIVRTMWASGIHVEVTSGLSGISHRRIRPRPLANEAMFYVERLAPTETQLVMKRALDLILASILIVITLPVVLVAGALVYIEDRGPILYRQLRVGHNGELFGLYKLRTMVPDAASLLLELRHLNSRSGPLFKIRADPRVTRVGRFLRMSSIDELPQLWNVLKGEMSLVGPRPALPEEAAEFDEALLARHQMIPGITGLWQVKARDDVSFDSYRRFDLFYLANWSIFLDLTIIFSTFWVVLIRAFRAFLHRGTTMTAAIE
jgi:exopolysaccharide biosynthesis polyprenyl glycosylphosphotransferase